MDVLTEIEVTDSYLGLDKSVKECQNTEPLHNCTTRIYLNTIFEKCGCVPLNIGIIQKVEKSSTVS